MANQEVQSIKIGNKFEFKAGYAIWNTNADSKGAGLTPLSNTNSYYFMEDWETYTI